MRCLVEKTEFVKKKKKKTGKHALIDSIGRIYEAPVMVSNESNNKRDASRVFPFICFISRFWVENAVFRKDALAVLIVCWLRHLLLCQNK